MVDAVCVCVLFGHDEYRQVPAYKLDLLAMMLRHLQFAAIDSTRHILFDARMFSFNNRKN